MVLQFLILFAGLALILLGSNYLVDGASSIARKFKISEFVIGLTIIGIGTSTPEMVVSYMSSWAGKSDMAIGNVIGSNIFNTALILGITALISPLAITKGNMRRDIPMNIAVTVLLICLGLEKSIFGFGDNSLGRVDGAIMLVIFAWYLYSSFKNGESGSIEDGSAASNSTTPTWLAAVMTAGGLAGLIFGGRLFVNSASELAKMFGVSDKFIAITVLAGGTSMPELATCVVAAAKKKGQMALGNIVGSNIANILLILGGAALINPLSFKGVTIVDLGTMLGCAIFIMMSAWMFKKKSLDRFEGIILLLCEAAYMWYLVTTL